MSYVVRYFATGLILLIAFHGRSQTSQTLSHHNWYFGNATNAIKFNRVTNAPTLVNNKAIPFGTGGSSVATDHNTANLLFYTDGNSVYDITHVRMPNGSGINANSTANQPTAICAVPGQNNKYFLFTNTANFTTGGSILRTVIDMGLFGNSGFPSPPFGDVETKNTAVGGLPARAEAMITIPHANGNDFWLITQQVNTQSFTATLINAASYTAGTFASIVSSSAPFPTTAAHFGYHPGLRKVVVAPQDPSTDAIILNFNDATGILGFDRIILNSGFVTTLNQSVYDIEWSPTGQYLYLSRHGEPGVTPNVFQYDYQNSAISLAPILPAPVFRSYGLQLAPDTTIYHLYQASAAGPFLVGRIEKPDTIATEVNYNPSPFGTTNFSGTQFPSFLPRDTVTLTVQFTSVGTCQDSPTNFFPEVTPGADSLIWDFGDASFGRGWGPVHTYVTSGTFNVALTAFYQGQTQTATQPVTINAFALQLQVTQDTTACRSEFPPPRGSSSPTQFQVNLQVTGGTPSSVVWSNGDMGNTLRPDSAGYYYVVVTDATGCTGYAGVNVREYGLQDQTRNKWYFGDRAGIDFTPQPPVALNESAMNAPEGCAIVCDRNGKTILYTDGQTVYDKTHAVIATNIGGNPASTQSALIVAVPGDETLYYIFTTQAINGTDSLKLMYSLFDLKLNAGAGAVVKQNVFLFAKSTERITSNGNWLIAHEYGNNTFRTYQITTQGIGDVVYSSIGSDHSFASQQNGEGYMKLGPRDNLAVALSSSGSNHIELFHLNDTLGTITNYRDIDLNEPTGQIYGVEFSPGGNKLFATVRLNSASSALFEYSIDSVEQPHFKQRLPAAAELGAIQVGPDGQIYVAVNDLGNNASLGTISPNEDTTSFSSFTLNGFALAAATTSRLGLPNFVQINSNALGGPVINISGFCAGGDSTRFSATPRDQIDEYTWSLRQGGTLLQGSTQATFAFLFTAGMGGNYTVSVRLHNRCAADTVLTRNFIIFEGPVNPTAGAVLCTGPATLDANPPNAPNLIYGWSTNETTETISINEQSTASVIVLDTLTGCFTLGQFLVADNRPQFDLGPDLTICEDNATPALNAQNPGTTYQWTVNGVNTSNAQALAVDTTTPGVFTYAVTVTDPVTTCAITDTKTYDIKVSPAFIFSGTNPISCGSPTGTVTLQLNVSTPSGGPLYSYFISGPGGTAQSNLDQTAPNTITINGRVAGTYSAIVTDQISGCTLSAATGLTDATYTATAVSQSPNCDPVIVRITTAGAVAYPVQYTATNGATGVVTTGTAPVGPSFNTTPLVAGDYVIDILDSSVPPCTFTFNHTVAPVTPAPVTITPDLCNLTLTASGAGAYTWTSTPPGGINGVATGPTIQLTPNFGQVTYDVTGTSAGCPSTQSINLNVGPALTAPVLSQSDACTSAVTISATPSSASLLYRWYRNGTLDNSLGGSQIQIGLTDNNVQFGLEIFEPQSGCTTARSTMTATVIGPVTGALTTTPPCEDGLPITLTATSTTPGVTFAWTLDGTLISGATSSSISGTAEGTYRVEIKRGPCAIFSEIDVIRAPLPDGQLPNRLIICNDPENADPATKSVDLDPGVFAQYDWSINGLSINYNQQVLTADSEGDYEVELINEFACVAIDETVILNDCLPKINAPNAFRPGSTRFVPDRPDLTNSDFWVITKFIEEAKFQIFIYNRWGEMVFSSESRAFKWNGGYNNNAGEPLPPGTYSYVIKYVSAYRPDKGVQEKRGGVALLR